MENTAPHDYSFGPNAERDYQDSLDAARGTILPVLISFAFWALLATGAFVATR